MKGIQSISNIDSLEQQTIDQIDLLSEEMRKELPPPHPNLKMAVIIPAKNEGQNIRFTLDSLAKQIYEDGSRFDSSAFEVLVLGHNCSDDTLAQCRKFFREHSQIRGYFLELNSKEINTVGAARRILMNIAYWRISIDNGLIISTDADTIVDKHWLYNLYNYIEGKVDLICGNIISDASQLEAQARSYLIAKDEYLLLKSRLESELFPNPHNPWPRHGFNWGPNLSIKKSVYGAIGGIRPLHFLEDVDLYKRVVSEGFIVKHCLKCKVTTSTRIDSRCSEGFGAELRVWTDIEGVAYKVEGLLKLLLRYKIYKLLQEYYVFPTSNLMMEILELSSIEEKELMTMIKKSERVEALTIKMEAYLNQSSIWNSKHPNTDIFKVCDELSHYFQNPAQVCSSNSSAKEQVHTDPQ